MNLSAPIYVLKSKAKKLKKEKDMRMSEALNEVARSEGFSSWSLLMSKKDEFLPTSYGEILDYFNPGDLIIIAARPMYGKTTFTIGLLVQAIKKARARNFFFSLSETHKDVARRISRFDESIGQDENFLLDYSNEISADYIISRINNEVEPGSVIIIDYLQLLDEKRTKPELQVQVSQLHEFAKKTGVIIIFISQVNREIEYKNDRRPKVSDIRLPNPLDLSMMNKKIFLYRENFEDTESEVIITSDGQSEHVFKVNIDPKKVRFW